MSKSEALLALRDAKAHAHEAARQLRLNGRSFALTEIRDAELALMKARELIDRRRGDTEFRGWCEGLQALAVETHGTITDFAAWREYFDEGESPSDALAADLAQA